MRKEFKIRQNIQILNMDKKDKVINSLKVIKSWEGGYKEKISNGESSKGLRLPQFGALSSIRSHWTISNAIATVVMPTGTGKTETMLATIISERIQKTLIIVPSDLLRTQLFNNAKEFGILPEIGVITKKVLPPNITLLKTGIKDLEQFKSFIANSNIIISTVSLLNTLSSDHIDYLSEFVDVLMIDEAHHITSTTWKNFRSNFRNKKIIQFTATPFRNDGKRVDGKIIYNFPLSKAQEEGYFKQIRFFPIEEFDERKGDLAIAEKAIEELKKDIELDLPHILLARVETKKRAEILFENIYLKYFPEFNPVLITSNNPTKKNQEYIQALKTLKSRVVVCVDMFGEGIDIPNLKIAAIHEKYKSLPITLQFIGRFARSKEEIGDAKIITNIANEDLKGNILSLYEQDADWNKLLSIESANLINKEMSFSQLIENFRNIDLSDIDIKQIKMKISTRVFDYSGETCFLEGWKQVLNQDNTHYFHYPDNSLIFLIEKVQRPVVWSNQQNIFELDWNLYMIYWNKEKNIIHINETDQGKGNRILENIFPGITKIEGEKVFRSLAEINKLMVGTLGLKSQLPSYIRFKMYAGIDVTEGITSAQSASTIKSNLFGNGYNGKGKVSIGCSYKGKIWSRWVESIDYWMAWCDEVTCKLQDETINTDDILKGSLKPVQITELPAGIPYKIVMNDEIEFESSHSKQYHLIKEDRYIPFYATDLKIISKTESIILFKLNIESNNIIFSYSIDESRFTIKKEEGNEVNVKIGKRNFTIEQYFNINPPIVTFIDSKGNINVLEGNLNVEVSSSFRIEFDRNKITPIKWKEFNVEIKKESQGINKKSGTIQHSVINDILKQQDYNVIFDDDDPGEIADIVTIKTIGRTIKFELYHCKYSEGDKPGSRVKDLYEVCGQAEKSVNWKGNIIGVIERLLYRENHRNSKGGTRFEVGGRHDLNIIKKQLIAGFEVEMKIYIVQPGIKKTRITREMDHILVAAQTYLQETYGLELEIFSS